MSMMRLGRMKRTTMRRIERMRRVTGFGDGCVVMDDVFQRLHPALRSLSSRQSLLQQSCFVPFSLFALGLLHPFSCSDRSPVATRSPTLSALHPHPRSIVSSFARLAYFHQTIACLREKSAKEPPSSSSPTASPAGPLLTLPLAGFLLAACMTSKPTRPNDGDKTMGTANRRDSGLSSLL